MNILSKYLKLSRSERVEVMRAIFAVVLVRLGLWVLPYRMVRRLAVKPHRPDSPVRRADPNSVFQVVRNVKSVSRYVPGATCLTQALATVSLAGTIGQQVDLKIGVALGYNGKFEAHAWVEVDQIVVIGKVPNHARFIPLSTQGGIAL